MLKSNTKACLHCTIGEIRLAEMQVIAGPGRIVLGAHGELHALDVLLEVVEGSEDVVHSLHAVVRQSLISLGFSLPPALFARLLNGQRLDHITRRTLQHRR